MADKTQAVERRQEAALLPAVDVIEDGDGITLYADLPGVSKDQLNVGVDAETLTIEAEVKIDLPEDMRATHAEIAAPRYRRVFSLSRELDADKVTAELHQGVLKLQIPKAEHAKPRRIDVQVR
jgi:HSP20 family protein